MELRRESLILGFLDVYSERQHAQLALRSGGTQSHSQTSTDTSAEIRRRWGERPRAALASRCMCKLTKTPASQYLSQNVLQRPLSTGRSVGRATGFSACCLGAFIGLCRELNLGVLAGHERIFAASRFLAKLRQCLSKIYRRACHSSGTARLF